MKQLLALMLCLALLAALSACAPEPEPPTAAPSTAAPTEETTAETTEETSEETTEETTEETSEETTEETEPEPWQAPEEGQELLLLYDEEIVTDGESSLYQVPQFRCDSAGYAQVNRDIEEKFGAIMERVRAGDAPEIVGISYELYRFRIYTLSLLICCDYADGTHSYCAYTLSLETGRLLNGAEILEALNISQESFLCEARARAAEVFAALYDGQPQDAAYRKALALSCGEKVINLNMQMFVDAEGHLMLISPIAAPDATGSFRQVYPLQKEFE